MAKYRFTGRIASFFRATGNSWASTKTVWETVGGALKFTQNEINNLHDYGHLERRGKRRSYEYRWNPETLCQEAERATQ